MFPNKLQRGFGAYAFDWLQIVAPEQYTQVDKLLMQLTYISNS